MIQERSSVLAAECASALLTSSSAHSCNPPEAFISVWGLSPPLRRICFVSPLIEVRVSTTEMNKSVGTQLQDWFNFLQWSFPANNSSLLYPKYLLSLFIAFYHNTHTTIFCQATHRKK